MREGHNQKMNMQKMHPHTIRWGLVFLGLVVLTLLVLMAGPAAQDQTTLDARASGGVIHGSDE